MKTTNNFTDFVISFKKPYAFSNRLPIDLSLSENPLGCSPLVPIILKKNLNDLAHYPDPNSAKLRFALSENFNIPVDKIAIGNGLDALIDLIPKILLNRGDLSILPETTFPLFEKAVILAGGRPLFSKMTEEFSINLPDIKRTVSKKVKLIFLCNPNNPTGEVLAKKKIIRFVRSVSPIFVIVDEANIEFGGQSVIEETKQLTNLIVLRTFSKGFGLASLRIGFCVADKSLIERINEVRQPFPVSRLSQAAAIVALSDDKFLIKTKKFMNQERKFLTRELKKRGFSLVKSQANNILVKVGKLFGTSTKFAEMLSRNGVSVVDGINFRGLGNSFIRISPRKRNMNKQFLKVIDKLLRECAS